MLLYYICINNKSFLFSATTHYIQHLHIKQGLTVLYGKPLLHLKNTLEETDCFFIRGMLKQL